VLAWLTRHPRWTFHFTPTSASWLNAVENFFSKMTRQRIRPRGLPLDLRSADRYQCRAAVSRLHTC
jgi:transposase